MNYNIFAASLEKHPLPWRVIEPNPFSNHYRIVDAREQVVFWIADSDGKNLAHTMEVIAMALEVSAKANLNEGLLEHTMNMHEHLRNARATHALLLRDFYNQRKAHDGTRQQLNEADDAVMHSKRMMDRLLERTLDAENEVLSMRKRVAELEAENALLKSQGDDSMRQQLQRVEQERDAAVARLNKIREKLDE